jgi:hypothetical protein
MVKMVVMGSLLPQPAASVERLVHAQVDALEVETVEITSDCGNGRFARGAVLPSIGIWLHG